MSNKGIKIVCQNRKARHLYYIESTVEAGLVLLGPEVKSLREARANITDGYVGFFAFISKMGKQRWNSPLPRVRNCMTSVRP
jgi:hypothetical protein